MSDATPNLSHGAEYLVLYKGGPNDGRSDTRISTNGSWDRQITVIMAVDGKETLMDYSADTWHEIGGQYQVNYVYDAADSEPVEDPEDRGGRQ